MNQDLQDWVKRNNLIIEETDNPSIISIKDVGRFLLIKGDEDGKVIDGEWMFILDDDEYELLDDRKVDYILFHFGGIYLYSPITEGKNHYGETGYVPQFNDFKYLGHTAEEPFVPFVHLGVHDEYEILNGTRNPKDWAHKANFMNMKALGVCDRNTLASTVAFQEACFKYDIKPIFGETIIVAHEYDPKATVQETYSLKLFIRNEVGWKNLLMINKLINVDYDDFIPEEELYKYGNGLTVVIPDDSEFNRNKEDKRYCVKLIARYKRVFDRVYYQIDTVEYVNTQSTNKHLSNIDQYICEYRKLIPPLLINDSYYLDQEEYQVKQAVNGVLGKNRGAESHQQYFKSALQTLQSYEHWVNVEPLMNTIIEAMQNTQVVADDCNFTIGNGNRKFPRYKVDGHYVDAEAMFFDLLQKGIQEKLVGKVRDMDTYMKRIQTECDLIVPNDLCDYFLILVDIVNWCRKEDIMVGPGRGSVCGSLVAYCLNITQVDPIPYALYFERFLNPSRVAAHRKYEVTFEDGEKKTYKEGDTIHLTDGNVATVNDSFDWNKNKIEDGKPKDVKVKKFYLDEPDVDIDFEPEGRDKVKDYIKHKYGLAYSCSVGTYTRAKLRTCLKDFGRVLGIPYDTMNVITKDIDEQLEYEWQDLFKFAAKNRRIYKFIQEHTDIVFLTKWALNTPKAESVHPSAVLILPDQDDDGKPINVYGWMPVKKIDGILVSEWEGKYTESELYLKEDILGLNQLTKFHHMLNLIKRDKGRVIDPGKIPLDDDEVFEYFRNGWCQDVFQFGTQSLMNYCKQVKPTEFSDLIAMSALFRPGPIASNAHSDFADIKNGRKKPKYDYGIKNITEETYSLLVYQEQMMSIIHQLGGLSLIDAENARKYIKKKKHKELAAMGSRFIEGAERNGCPKDEAKRIWDKMNAFSSYSFNKSHAAAYSLMSYWSNWFKVHYPLEFWTTAFDLSKDSGDIPYMMNEMIATGVDIEVRPPDINHSDLGFTCDPENNRIFYSLSKIKGIGPVAVQNIIETRNQGGEFFDLEEFLERVPKSKVNKGVVVKLILSGAFDLLLELPNQHKRRDVLKHYLEDIKGESLPDEYSTAEAVASDAFWIMKQKELTGFGDIDFSMLIRQRIDVQRVQRIYLTPTQLEHADDGKQAAIAGRLIYFRERKIKSGTMVTLTIDNNNSILSVVCWPDSNLTEDWLDVKGKLICITGVVKRDTYRGKKTLYTDAFSRLYLLSEEKTKFSKRDEWLNSKK